jgi:ribonuclease P protein component
MISRAHRFHGYNSLRYVYKHGRTVRGPVMATKFVINERRKIFRVAVVVSKKVNKSAVIRNRIRRRLYEIVRQCGPQIGQPYDIVITVFNEQIADMPSPELERMVRAQFRQAGLLRNPVKK